MQERRPILVVDDEKNIRLTLSEALGSIAPVDTAMNGEEALEMLVAKDYAVVLLDLKMPGMDGMAVLREVAAHRPDVRFIIITAHGSVENAVEAMKLGAVDYIQKPFTPEEIRFLVLAVLRREVLDPDSVRLVEEYLELAKRHINRRNFDAALEVLLRASGIEPRRADVFNLLGAIHEIQGRRREAIDNYRTAYWADQSHSPARENLERIMGALPEARAINLGEGTGGEG